MTINLRTGGNARKRKLVEANFDRVVFPRRELEMKLFRMPEKFFSPRPPRLRAVILMLVLTPIALVAVANFAATAKDEPHNNAAARGVDAPPVQGLNAASSRGNSIADAAELSALADKLRDELKKTNVNVLPLPAIQKTQAMEKLAKKIKGETVAR